MMSFQEKYEEYKQRKEAQAFFNQNNDQKVYGKDYLIAILVGFGSTIVMGCILTWIISKIGFNFSYFTILIGIFADAESGLFLFFNAYRVRGGFFAVLEELIGHGVAHLRIFPPGLRP